MRAEGCKLRNEGAEFLWGAGRFIGTAYGLNSLIILWCEMIFLKLAHCSTHFPKRLCEHDISDKTLAHSI